MSISVENSSKLVSQNNWAFRRSWIVTTTTGPVAGHAETGVAAFRGIPYAKPPIGELRFRRARPIEPWSTPLLATESGSPCTQLRNADQGVIGSENCLWLDVVVPRDPASHSAVDTSARRPVVVFFHGGSNAFGSAANRLYSSQYLATALDAVVVAVNYRLGVSGGLSLSYGTQPSSFPADRFDTNTQLSDAVAALTWVHDNAEVFGGDPHRIVTMGQSSGGGLVASLTALPQLEQIIAGVIMLSPPLSMVHHPDLAALWANRLFDRCEDPVSVDSQKIGALSGALLQENVDNLEYGGPFAPVIDGDLLPRHPLEITPGAPGVAGKVPLLIGTVSHEYYFMRLRKVTTATQRRHAQRFAESIGPDAADVFRHMYHNGRSRTECAQLFGDSLFWAPSIALAEQWSPSSVWMYRLDASTPFFKALGLGGATHTWDLPLLFGCYDAGMASKAFTFGGLNRLKETTAAMQRRWRHFVHDGTPGFAPYADDRSTHIFGDDGETTANDPRRDMREAWASVGFANIG
ncbi:carboxylesterase family protein [uncultured Corynebacterium sp.]|uniref:carboxylesterase family protein n=1 Tax=uncultured Corynebacterium sp. TaxID=159447 RepID=UPI0025FC4788|nr:carboxylesterase family protein [uncultured Corynebacterium sp.]